MVLLILCVVVLSLGIGVGVWRGRRYGAARGLKAGLITVVIALFGLFALFAAVIALYYARGGH
jgi:hypothetical protein